MPESVLFASARALDRAGGRVEEQRLVDVAPSASRRRSAIERRSHAVGDSFPDCHRASPWTELHRALAHDCIWSALVGLVSRELPYRSCSLFLCGPDREPRRAWHHVREAEAAHYRPASTLAVARPFLDRHPGKVLYTYSEIVDCDPDAALRRAQQERGFREWTDFLHLAFWERRALVAVVSIRQHDRQARPSSEQLAFLGSVYEAAQVPLERAQAHTAVLARVAQLERRVGRSSAPPSAGAALEVRSGDTAVDAVARLTRAERAVAFLAAEGLRNDEIAARLFRSRRTVEFQLGAVYRKLGVRGRVELARSLHRHHAVEASPAPPSCRARG